MVTPRPFATTPRQFWCSTPFGIKGMVTFAVVRGQTGRNTCSTPFGIKGMVTTTLRCGQGKTPVLNAFRHQRNGHSRDRFCDDDNPVLNAFRHQRNGHGDPGTDHRRRQRAQRLSASKEWSRRQRDHRRRQEQVLNAFRHQRNGHLGLVLVDDFPPLVLNAFRHQRNGHAAAVWEDVSTYECSTPFGIKGMVTPKSSPSRPTVRSAQRLSASKEWSPSTRLRRLHGF